MTGAWTLPRCAVLDGQEYEIHTDYRDILEVLRWLSGGADPQLKPEERWYIAMRLFYPGFAAMPAALWGAATTFCRNFCWRGVPSRSPAPRS